MKELITGTALIEVPINALATATRFGPGGRHFDDLVHHPVLDEEVWDNRFLKGLWERARIHIADQGDGRRCEVRSPSFSLRAETRVVDAS